MQNNFVDVEKRVKRYWYEDGIAELAIGGMFILLGLYFGIQGYFGEGSTLGVILQVSMVFVMIVGILGSNWAVRILKARLTYPRTGYVEYKVRDREASQRRYIVVAVGLIVAVASIVLINFIRGLDSMVLATGILVGVVCIALRGKSSGVTRFYYLGAFSLLLGIGLSLDHLSQTYNLGLFYGLLGVALVASGGLTLQRYLVENPMPTDLENDNE